MVEILSIFTNVKDLNRFGSSHASLYLLATFTIILIFIIDKLTGCCTISGTGCFSRLVNSCWCCCTVYERPNRELSTNIFEDISPEALQQEYEETLLLREAKENELKKRTLEMEQVPEDGKDIPNYDESNRLTRQLLKKLETKLREIKLVLFHQLKEHKARL